MQYFAWKYSPIKDHAFGNIHRLVCDVIDFCVVCDVIDLCVVKYYVLTCFVIEVPTNRQGYDTLRNTQSLGIYMYCMVCHSLPELGAPRVCWHVIKISTLHTQLTVNF